MTETASVQPPNLFSRTIRGGIWILISRVGLQILTVVKITVLGRLLSPREFGVLGIAMLSIDALTTFTQTGFFSALVQKREKTEEFVHAAWTVAVVRGIILFLVLFFMSPYIVHFFDSSGRFEPMDFPKPNELAIKITSVSNPLSTYLFESFSEAGRQKIKEAENIPPREMEIILAGEFNSVCEKQAIYTPQRFSEIPLSAYVKSRINNNQEPLTRLNRLLLEEAFPREIKKRVLDVQQITAVLRTMAVLFLIYGFSNSRIFLLTKNLNFDKTFYLQNTQAFCGLCTTILLAFWLRNVWALVFGQLFSVVVGLVLGYILVPYRPRLDWNWNKARQLWKFGRHITGMDTLTFLLSRGDTFFVGKILGITTMGYYRYAIQIAELVTQEISGMISIVSFPVFSCIQDNITKVRNGYHKSMHVINLVGYPVIGLVVILAPNIVRTLLGDNWLPIISSVRILCLVGLVSALGQARSVFLSLNRPDIQMKLILLRIGILVFLLYPLTQTMGIAGTAAAMVVSRFLIVPAGFAWTKRLIQSGLAEFLKTIRIPGAAIILTAGVVWPLQRFSNTTSILHLLGLAGLGIAVYIFAGYLLDKTFNRSEAFRLFREAIGAAMKRSQGNLVCDN